MGKASMLLLRRKEKRSLKRSYGPFVSCPLPSGRKLLVLFSSFVLVVGGFSLSGLISGVFVGGIFG
jgi:hypothetical protein